eukprot:scaffold133687_cov31-Tisochrysis_lutea.AAC.4
MEDLPGVCRRVGGVRVGLEHSGHGRAGRGRCHTPPTTIPTKLACNLATIFKTVGPWSAPRSPPLPPRHAGRWAHAPLAAWTEAPEESGEGTNTSQVPGARERRDDNATST